MTSASKIPKIVSIVLPSKGPGRPESPDKRLEKARAHMVLALGEIESLRHEDDSQETKQGIKEVRPLPPDLPAEASKEEVVRRISSMLNQGSGEINYMESLSRVSDVDLRFLYRKLKELARGGK